MNLRTKRHKSSNLVSTHGRTGIRALSTALALLFSLAASDILAVGTPAGTVIRNIATINYTLEGKSLSQTSNISTIKVDDKVIFTLMAADATAASITPGGTAYMTYILTNSGNGPHDFTLNAAVTGTPDFTSATSPIFCTDTVCTVPLPVDPNAGGLPYVTNLAPDTSRNVYMQITAPKQLTDGQTIKYLVTAEAYQLANLGTVNPPVKSSTQAAIDTPIDKNKNPVSQYVILADGHGNGGDADRDGRYAVIAKDGADALIGFKARSANVSVVKAVVVTDKAGGTQPFTGSTLRYTLTVTATGTGSAQGVVITDPLPTNTSYTAGTLKLNDAPLSDAADSDAGDIGVTTANVVTVKLGDMTSNTPTQTITFDVKIN